MNENDLFQKKLDELRSMAGRMMIPPKQCVNYSAERAADEIEMLRAENERLTNEYLALNRAYLALRRGTDRVKVRAYELGQMELHDLAWSALIGEKPTDTPPSASG